MSAVAGLERVKSRLARLGEFANERLEQAIEQGAKKMQSDMVAIAPRRTGKLRSLLASNDALRVIRSRGKTRAEVGFRTPAMRKAGFMYFFVETGTKGYEAGWQRRAGTDKRGRKRYQRIKRRVPARPAQPFFRPALVNLQRNMARLRKEAWARAAGDMLVRG